MFKMPADSAIMINFAVNDFRKGRDVKSIQLFMVQPGELQIL
jgi:hypothetical protein